MIETTAGADRAYSLAQDMITKYGRVSADELAAILDITILYANYDKLKGVYFVADGHRYISLKNDLPTELHNIVVFHEIGHDLMHGDLLAEGHLFREVNVLCANNDRLEHEANLFAAEMMLADEDILEYIYQGYNVSQVASAMSTDENLVALKVSELNRRGFSFREQNYNDVFLKDD